MDLTWSDGEETFRAEARAWLEENLAALARRARRRGRHRLGRHPRGVRPAPRLGAPPARRPLGRRVVAERGRRARRLAVGVADLRGGVLPGGRPAPRHPERHLPAGPHRVRVRDARAAGARPAPHGGGRGPVVPGLVRARRRQRPGRHQGPGHPGRRRLAARRPEDVDHPRRVLHPPVRPVPHRPRVRAAPRPQLPAGPARHARASRSAGSGVSTATRGSPRCSSTTPSWPTTPCPAGCCWATRAPAGRWRWRRPGRSGA